MKLRLLTAWESISFQHGPAGFWWFLSILLGLDLCHRTELLFFVPSGFLLASPARLACNACALSNPS